MFFPDIALDNVTQITKEMLDVHRIKGLIIDIDNTLTLHNSQTIAAPVNEWLDNMSRDFSVVLLSNNMESRVAPFGEMLSKDYFYSGGKPLPSKGLKKALEKLDLEPSQVAVIGDQILTDVLGGNWIGALTIRVEPIQTEGGLFFKSKRLFENIIMKKYYKHKNREKK